jgi:hypothetical protein
MEEADNMKITNSMYLISYEYNTETGLYDLAFSDNSLADGYYRIYNETDLTNEGMIGYFYISPDNKYIFLPNDNHEENVKNLYKYSNYAKLNNLTNSQLYEIANDPAKKSQLYNLAVPSNFCITLAFEEYIHIRNPQMIKTTAYTKYDCLAKSLLNKMNSENSNANTKESVCICNNIDINEYNIYYMRAFGIMNVLLIFVSIILIYSMFEEPHKHRSHSSRF